MTAVEKHREGVKAVDEKSALRALKPGNEAALKGMIDRYAAYVGTIIYNIIGSFMTVSDVEEVASDVFLALWSNAEKVRPGKVKAYLSGVARNKAKEKTREMGYELPLDDDVVVVSNTDLERDFEEREQAGFIRQAVLAMSHPDREIFLRHYYYCQSVSQISEEMGINPSTVKTKLRRGREKLKEIISEGGYGCGQKNIRYDGLYTGRLCADPNQ